MGIFDWLAGTKNNVEVAEDRIWLSQLAKSTGLSKEVGAGFLGHDPPIAVILVAHFADCLDELHKTIEANSFAGPVTATLAGNLKGSAAAQSPLHATQIIYIVVAERHPLRSHDEAVMDFARSLPCRCRIVHHVSLEDPLMKCFAGEWIENVLKQLGMKENEAIRSQMVARRIAAAQKKIEGQATGDQPSASAQEWIERNCRS